MPISANRPKTGRFKKFLGRNESAFNLIRKHFNDKNCHLPSLGQCSAGRYGKMPACQTAKNGPISNFFNILNLKSKLSGGHFYVLHCQGARFP